MLLILRYEFYQEADPNAGPGCFIPIYLGMPEEVKSTSFIAPYPVYTLASLMHLWSQAQASSTNES